MDLVEDIDLSLTPTGFGFERQDEDEEPEFEQPQFEEEGEQFATDSEGAAAADWGGTPGPEAEAGWGATPGSQTEAEAPARSPRWARPPRGPSFSSVVPRAVLAAAGLAMEAEARTGQDRFEPLLEQEILGADDRRLVADTLPVPFRFICALDLLFPVPGNADLILALRGSGTLISDRHVLTAGHNVLDDLSNRADARAAGFGPGRIRPNAIFATPGRNGSVRPFGSSRAVTVRAAPAWVSTGDVQADFALLTLAHSIGTPPRPSLGGRPLGFWGHKSLGGGTRINPLAPAKLRQVPVNLSGYPVDKCAAAPAGRSATAAEMTACPFVDRGSVQFRSFGTVTQSPASGLPTMFAHDLDTASGHSGSPTWLRWKDFRNLVGIHRGGLPQDDPPFTIIASLDVLVTEEVLAQLRTWMRADGVTPSF